MFRVCHAFLSIDCSLVVACWQRANLLALLYMMFSCVFYAPNFGKVERHIAFRLSVRACVHPSVHPLQNLLRYSFEISYTDFS